MRHFLILFFNICCFNIVSAQFCPPLSGKLGETKKYHITAGYGITKIFGDVNQNTALGSAGTVAIDYQIKKGLLIGIESQFGSLRTEVSTTADPRQSHNNYFAGGLRLTMHPFGFFSRRNYLTSYGDVLLESLYVGVGSLIVSNKYDYIYHNVNDLSSYGMIKEFDSNDHPIFEDRTQSLIFPSVNIGAAVPLNNKMNNNGPILSLVINAQFNMSQNDVLDGYTPYGANGKVMQGANDFYNFYSLGIRYSF